VHLATAIASGLLILAFLAIRSHPREAGEDRYSALGVPNASGKRRFAYRCWRQELVWTAWRVVMGQLPGTRAPSG
jgi:hypothetical protein